jgi:chromosome partitioning protein
LSTTTSTYQAAVGAGAGIGPKFIVVVQQRGVRAGVSTIAVNLAAVCGRSSVLHNDITDAAVVAAGIDPRGSLEAWSDRVPEEALPFDYLLTRGRLGVLSRLAGDPARKRVIVDSPGLASGDDPVGRCEVPDAAREVLDLADLAVVPVTPDQGSWTAAESVIETVLKPRRIRFFVVVNLHDPENGDGALDPVKRWADGRSYPRAADPIRKYKVHAHSGENGLTVVEYKTSGTTLRAREDFLTLALCMEQLL